MLLLFEKLMNNSWLSLHTHGKFFKMGNLENSLAKNEMPNLIFLKILFFYRFFGSELIYLFFAICSHTFIFSETFLSSFVSGISMGLFQRHFQIHKRNVGRKRKPFHISFFQHHFKLDLLFYGISIKLEQILFFLIMWNGWPLSWSSSNYVLLDWVIPKLDFHVMFPIIVMYLR